jgi:hypothetical protein
LLRFNLTKSNVLNGQSTHCAADQQEEGATRSEPVVAASEADLEKRMDEDMTSLQLRSVAYRQRNNKNKRAGRCIKFQKPSNELGERRQREFKVQLKQVILSFLRVCCAPTETLQSVLSILMCSISGQGRGKGGGGGSNWEDGEVLCGAKSISVANALVRAFRMAIDYNQRQLVPSLGSILVDGEMQLKDLCTATQRSISRRQHWRITTHLRAIGPGQLEEEETTKGEGMMRVPKREVEETYHAVADLMVHTENDGQPLAHGALETEYRDSVTGEKKTALLGQIMKLRTADGIAEAWLARRKANKQAGMRVRIVTELINMRCPRTQKVKGALDNISEVSGRGNFL